MVHSRRFAQCELYDMKDGGGNGQARLVFHEDYEYYDNLLGGKSRRFPGTQIDFTSA